MTKIREFFANLNLSKKQIISVVVFIILLLGIPVGVFLVQKTQILKSRASSNPIIDALDIKDSSGNPITCNSSTNPPTCETSTQDITITVKDLSPLSK